MVQWTIANATATVTIPCSNGDPLKVKRTGVTTCSVGPGQLTAAGAPWSVSADYLGDGNYTTSNGSLTGAQRVHVSSSNTYVGISPNPPERNSAFHLTATVAGPRLAGPPSGTVTFAFTPAGSITCDGGSNTISFSGAGGAVCTFASGLPFVSGGYVVSATYSGDGNLHSSTSKSKKISVH
jgi:hypothetical protein